jgi:hypothetical protein
VREHLSKDGTSASIIGLIQRMLLLVLDKADNRAITATSISEILACLYKHGCVQVLQHCISFTLSLSTATKVLYRALCTDISVHLLLSTWIWLENDDVDKPTAQLEKPLADVNPSTNAVALLRGIIARCYDVSPAIRLRAVTGLQSVLLSLNENSSSNKHRVVAYFLNDTLSDEEGSIQEAIRERCSDDRPLVRAKALSAYEYVVTYHWILCDEEDIDLFITACSDKSVSVRKQGLGSIMNILRMKTQQSNHLLLLDVFVQACTPLIFDAVHPLTTIVYNEC